MDDVDPVETFMNKQASDEQIRKLASEEDTITIPHGEASFIGEQPSDFDLMAPKSKELGLLEKYISQCDMQGVFLPALTDDK